MTDMPFSLTGKKTALITGGTSGLGLQTAKRFIKFGGMFAKWAQSC